MRTTIKVKVKAMRLRKVSIGRAFKKCVPYFMSFHCLVSLIW